jgi:hypothetical protein
MNNMNNMTDFIIGILTHSRYDYLDELLIDIHRQSVKPKEIIISDNGIGYNLKQKFDIPITIIKNGYNYGTCRGINQIIKLSNNNHILFMCDDLYFINENSLEDIITKFKYERENNSIHLIWCNNWAGFFASKEWIECVGLFDENIWPCYYEDSDFVERIRKKGNISHNCIGYPSLNTTGPDKNWEETKVIGNKRGTCEPIISVYYTSLKHRNLLYHGFKWKENNNDGNDMHSNTYSYYIDQKDVNLFKFEISYLKNKVKDIEFNNEENIIYPFIEDILSYKEFNFNTIVEYKTQKAYMSRLLLHLKPVEFITYSDKFDLSHDICHHINYLFNYNIKIKLRTTDEIKNYSTDLLVINNDCDLDILNKIQTKYLFVFSKKCPILNKFEMVKHYDSELINFYILKYE